MIDMNDSVRKETGVEDAYLKIYPISGYGNQELLRTIMNIEKPDAILHYTDPRFWTWLYRWNMKLDNTFLFFIIIFGMIDQHQDTTSSFTSLVI